jgi:hypothetical protein
VSGSINKVQSPDWRGRGTHSGQVTVRLTRKLADVLNGIDLSAAAVGDILEVPLTQGQLLIAEGWAVPCDPAPQERADAANRVRRRTPEP